MTRLSKNELNIVKSQSHQERERYADFYDAVFRYPHLCQCQLHPPTHYTKSFTQTTMWIEAFFFFFFFWKLDVHLLLSESFLAYYSTLPYFIDYAIPQDLKSSSKTSSDLDGAHAKSLPGPRHPRPLHNIRDKHSQNCRKFNADSTVLDLCNKGTQHVSTSSSQLAATD